MLRLNAAAKGRKRPCVGSSVRVNVIEAKVLTAGILNDLDDGFFERSRLQRRRMMAHYMEHQPGFAQDREVGAMFKSPTLDWLANNACDQITTTIGFLELARRRGAADRTSTSAAT